LQSLFYFPALLPPLLIFLFSLRHLFLSSLALLPPGLVQRLLAAIGQLALGGSLPFSSCLLLPPGGLPLLPGCIFLLPLLSPAPPADFQFFLSLAQRLFFGFGLCSSDSLRATVG
jgi:hypothetical protein